MYFFWGEGCPHCAKADPFLEKLDSSSDAVSLYKYEVYHSSQNQSYLRDVAKKMDISASGVPVIVIGNQAFVGYSESSSQSISRRVDNCVNNGCSDDVADIVGVTKPIGKTSETGPVVEDKNTSPISNLQKDSDEEDKTFNLPLFGEVHVKDFSLPALTAIIALLDGFNPCAMWTLMFLISVLLGMKSRRRMWALGGTFIVTSAVVYFLFMTAWLNIFLFLGLVTWVKILIGLVALGAGGYYLYDFWNNRNGTCKVTGGEKRQAVFEKIRHIAHEKSFWLALGGITILAFAVNLVELVCSAGLPAVYTSILSGSNLASWQYYAYIAFYILIFMVDDLFVFFAAMFTLKMVGVHTSYARYAHLIGGVLMLVLGILLILAPQLLMFG
jgi:glutaredoxin